METGDIPCLDFIIKCFFNISQFVVWIASIFLILQAICVIRLMDIFGLACFSF